MLVAQIQMRQRRKHASLKSEGLIIMEQTQDRRCVKYCLWCDIYANKLTQLTLLLVEHI